MSNHGAIALYEAFGSFGAGVSPPLLRRQREDVLIMWRTPSTLEGRLDDIPAVGPVPRSELGDPGRSRPAATTRGGRRHHRRRDPLERDLVGQGVHDRYGGVVPELAPRVHHLELTHCLSCDDCARTRRRDVADIELGWRPTLAPGLVGALLVGAPGGEGAGGGPASRWSA